MKEGAHHEDETPMDLKSTITEGKEKLIKRKAVDVGVCAAGS